MPVYPDPDNVIVWPVEPVHGVAEIFWFGCEEEISAVVKLAVAPVEPNGHLATRSVYDEVYVLPSIDNGERT